MRIFLTGSSGYVGTNLILQLQSQYDITGFDTAPSQLTNIDFVQGSLLDIDLLREIFMKTNFDAVIHLGALKDAADSVSKPDLYMQTNVVGTKNLIQSMSENLCKRIIFASSAAVYDSDSGIEMKVESSATTPISPYGLSKLLAEELILDFSDRKIIEPTILRFFNVTGGNCVVNSKLKQKDFISLAVRASILSNSISIYGNRFPTLDGTAIRDYINVSDVVGAIQKVIDGPKQVTNAKIYNVSTGTGVSVLEIINQVQTISGKSIEYKMEAAREGEIGYSVGNSGLLQSDYGWKPKSSLQDSIAQVVESELLKTQV